MNESLDEIKPRPIDPLPTGSLPTIKPIEETAAIPYVTISFFDKAGMFVSKTFEQGKFMMWWMQLTAAMLALFTKLQEMGYGRD